MTVYAKDHGDGIVLHLDHHHEVGPRSYKLSYQTLRELVGDLLTMPGMQWRPGDPPLAKEGE